MAVTGDPYILNEARSEPLGQSFVGATILVEASYYLQQFIDNRPHTEPLLSALGGFPLSLQMHIEKNLAKWQEHQITPVFIFEGQLIVGKEEMNLSSAKAALKKTERAWELYANNQANRAVKDFGESCAFTQDPLTAHAFADRRTAAVKADKFFTFFQRILVSKEIQFQTAPHNACAQIAYLDKLGVANDAILASKEILLYPLSDTCYLTEINFEKETAHGLIRSDLLRKLGVTEETFIDSLLMTGTSFLPTFPALKDQSITTEQPYSIQTAINMYRTAGHSIQGICNTFDAEVKLEDPAWKKKCFKAKMMLKHSVTLHSNGTVVVANLEYLTGDHHEYLGLRLPQELYHYLCAGTLRLRIVNQLSSLETFVLPPLDGGEAVEYRRLVSEQLTPVREQGLALVVGRVNDARMARAFQHKKVNVKFWYDDQKVVTLDHMAVSPRPQDIVKTWSVKKATWAGQTGVTNKAQPGSFTFAILSLRNKEFAKSTISKESAASNISDKEEIVANTLWRFLQLRGYINEAHELTIWGEALAATIEDLGSKSKLDEAAFLAMELLKYDQLNVRNRHEEWVGSSIRGSDDDKNYCLLIARCASLLKLRHVSIGYTGPLSKNLLAFQSITSAVRESDRDLTETVFAAMFLYAHAERHQKHWEDLGLSLPLADDNDIALGIAVKTFLDDHTDPSYTAEERRERRAKYAGDYLPYAVNFPEDIEIAFNFFDALCAGVKVLGNKVKDENVWTGAKEYLQARRGPAYDPSKDGPIVNGTTPTS